MTTEDVLTLIRDCDVHGDITHIYAAIAREHYADDQVFIDALAARLGEGRKTEVREHIAEQRRVQREHEREVRERERERKRADADRREQRRQEQAAAAETARIDALAALTAISPALHEAVEIVLAKKKPLQRLIEFIVSVSTPEGAAECSQKGRQIPTLDPMAREAIYKALKLHLDTPIGPLRQQVNDLIAQRREAREAVRAQEEQAARIADAPDWAQPLARNAAGSIVPNMHNCMLALQSGQFEGTLGYDELRNTPVWLRDPGLSDTIVGSRRFVAGQPVVDEDATRLQAAFDPHVPFKYDCLQRALNVVAERNSFHPVRDWITSQQWDGTARVKSFLTKYCGAKDNQYSEIVSRIWLVSAVARIMSPGCKADCMPVLEGDQGKLKSTFIRKLHGDEFFTDQIGELGSKDSQQDLAGVWVVEIAELDKLNRADASAAKRFISILVDKYRPSFGRRKREFPRQVIFVGSINLDGDGSYLKDSTGNRRYLPISIQHCDIDAVEHDRAQIFAEALVMYKAGEKWWPVGTEVQICETEQLRRQKREPWAEEIVSTLEPRNTCTTHYLLTNVLNFEPRDINDYHAARMGTALRMLGWLPQRRELGGVQFRFFSRPDFNDIDSITRENVNAPRPKEIKPAVNGKHINVDDILGAS